MNAMLAVLAVALTVGRSTFQAGRILRSGAHGVSLETWLMATLNASLWFAYGIVFHIPAEWLANIPSLMVVVVVVVLVATHQHSVRRASIGVAGIAAFTMACSLVSAHNQHPLVLSSVAVAASILMFTPQLRVVFIETDLSGVSVASWTLALSAAIAWVAYGLVIHQPAIVIPSLFQIPVAIIIIIRTVIDHPKAMSSPRSRTNDLLVDVIHVVPERRAPAHQDRSPVDSE